MNALKKDKNRFWYNLGAFVNNLYQVKYRSQ